MGKGRVWENGRLNRPLQLQIYSDSNYAEDIGDRKSTSGYVVQVDGTTIDWGSRKQSLVADSSTAAELVAAHTAVKALQSVASLLEQVGARVVKPVVMFEDNQGVIAAVKRGPSPAMKPYAVRFMYVRDAIERGEANLQYIDTSNNLADMMTKALARDKFIRFCGMLGVGRVVEALTGRSSWRVERSDRSLKPFGFHVSDVTEKGLPWGLRRTDEQKSHKGTRKPGDQGESGVN